MKRAATSIEADLDRARGDRELLEQHQAQGSDRDLSPAIEAAREREMELEAELQESREEPSVFESYFAEEEKGAEPDAEPDTPDDSVFQAYFGEEPEPDAGQPEEGLFAEMAKEGGLMDRLTEHAIDAVTDKDQEPEM